jgi:polyisoprenoid-binding protein YceI
VSYDYRQANAADVTTKEAGMKTLSDHRLREILSGRWELDPQRSSVEFRVGNFWGLATVRGHFDRYQGRLDLSADPAIELNIEASSVQTGNRKRDQHLRSPDFFDADGHPSVRFVSESVVPDGNALKVHGLLFARDRSIPLDLDAQVREADGGLEIKAATGAVHRDLGMTWSPLRMILPRSELLVSGHLQPATE